MPIQQTYTGDQVKELLKKSMETFQKGMIELIRDCANSPRYNKLHATDALNAVADKLETLKS